MTQEKGSKIWELKKALRIVLSKGPFAIALLCSPLAWNRLLPKAKSGGVRRMRTRLYKGSEAALMLRRVDATRREQRRGSA